ncbi:TonB-dependent hemoglobin/transferrin/lactoferrin family receptor [Undibacterium sp. FT147W]|uniref:TonB-dependent hemoglobin/transferrin/lactoferrin family receptor n=1 Tax=Undibacterium rivi TaxID=2828729 RepID=A0ABS5H4C8_9BURK|nr:TonB-dependent hemoglobin/transferrin/lactoferrin family receptor [Undibacterium rivi]MBR7793751.1 TonB-dependent hemoglobin/transferrin/lactoferrin family receptor [Undibacterium rivi]
MKKSDATRLSGNGFRIKTHTLRLLLAGLFSTGLTAYVQAQTAPQVPATLLANATVPVQIVVISGARYEQFVEDLPLSMDIIGWQEMESGHVADIHDLVKNLPNISVKRAPARFTVTGVGNATGRDTNAGFNIRGQDGNRVLMLVDGVRLPRSYINGSNAFGRDSLSLDLIRQVEIVRGPASVLYGSDGLAGLVNFITLEPADFLQRRGDQQKDVGGKVSLSYNGDDHSRTLSASLAGRINPALTWLVSAAVNHAGGMQNMGSKDVANVDRTTPNPQKNEGQSVLVKLVYQPTADQKHTVSAEHVNKDADYELLSSRAKLPLTTASAVTGENATSNMTRDRLSVQSRYTLNSAYVDHVQTALSFQDASSREFGVTHRNTLADRVRDVSYSERSAQFHIQTDKLFRMAAGWSQRLSYGLDYSRADIKNMFDGVDPGNADFVPRKYFPDTRDSSRAVFVQDEIFAGKWIITPGVRFDHFDLDVISQAGFAPPAKTPAKSLSGSAVSPKLGFLYRLTPEWSAFANYASGFRAPNAQQINGVFDSATIPAVLLSNPDLKPEKSHNIEIGLRAMLDRLSLDIAVFRGKYDNLIVDKKPLGGKGVIGDPAIFQTVNVDKATISGFEIKGQVQWGEIAGGKLAMPFAYGVTHGSDDTTGLPLNAIDPAKISIGVSYGKPAWEVRLQALHQDAKMAADLDSPYLPKPATPPRVAQLTIPSAMTLDLSGQLRLQKNLRLNAAVRNLTNKKYWNWSDVQGVAANSAVIDAYTQPGRHYDMSVSYDF